MVDNAAPRANSRAEMSLSGEKPPAALYLDSGDLHLDLQDAGFLLLDSNTACAS